LVLEPTQEAVGWTPVCSILVYCNLNFTLNLGQTLSKF
jgi:hypothetical protein